MTPQVFEFFSTLVERESGIQLTADKKYLLESRLAPLVLEKKMRGLDDLGQSLRAKNDRALVKEVVDAMTTNETFFFRDGKPFDRFRDVILPRILKSRASRRSFRIWSAASSSGQEAYSLAMLIEEQGPRLDGWRYEIVGTDISKEMVEKARSGLYFQSEVQRGLPIHLLLKYFTKNGSLWQIDASLRALVDFREHNLLADLKALGTFDVVFCRNVLIYFDLPTKQHVLRQIARALASDGVLLLGGAETVLGVSDEFQMLPDVRGIYGLGCGEKPARPTPRTPETE